MATLSNPSEIARETLKQMLARRLPPLPENYRSIYNEIAGTPDKGETFPDREIKSLLPALPKETTAQQRLARQIEQALRNGNWDAYRGTLVDFVREQGGESEHAWSELITDLLRQWDAKQSGLTLGRKRESLEHVLNAGAKNSDLLFKRLQGLTRAWSMNQVSAEALELSEELPAEAPEETLDEPTATSPGAVAAPGSRASEILAELRELFAYTLETVVAAQLAEQPELQKQTRALAAGVRKAMTLKALQDFQGELKRFAYRLEFVAEDYVELQGALLHLLQLMIENISELVVDDRWLDGQVAIVRDIITRPLNLRSVNDAERHIKEVIFKQSQLKQSLLEAREALKQMLAGFVDHLAEFADSTSDYHDKMESYIVKIGQANDISQLENVIKEVVSETRIIQLNAQRSRDDLRMSKQRVDDAEKRINELQNELDQASQLVRRDQLTGALNRRGLEELFDTESSRSRRRQSPLCVALLDIDNFKKLNDSFGHDVGDAALIHLATVIRETLRPQDTLARYGGEEFVILLPDTSLDDAGKALTRLQRELTKRYFLTNNERLLITFSAGLTELRADDSQESVLKRADEAMYDAKKTGKNRVVSV